MKLTKLALENFMSHENTELDLSIFSACSIVGQNGAGKSAIFEAMLWALFGHARIPNKELIRSGQTKMAVTLEFSMAGQDYVIRRSCNNGAITIRALVNGEELGQGPAAVNLRLSQLFGISRELLMESVVITQGRLASFLTAYSSERRDLIIAALGLEKYTKAGESAKALLKDAETELQGHQNSFMLLRNDVNKLSSYEEIDQHVAEFSKQLAEARERVKALTGKRDVIIAQDKDARETLGKLNTESSNIKSRLDKAMTDFTSKIAVAQSTVESADKQIASLEEAKQNLLTLEDFFQQAKELLERTKELNSEAQHHASEITLRQSRLDITLHASGTCPICRSQIDIQRWQEVVGQMKAELMDLTAKKDQASRKSQAIILPEQPHILSKKIDQTKERITQINMLKDSRPSYEQNVHALQEQKQTMLDTLTEQLQRANTGIDAAKAKINIELDNIERELGTWEFAEEQYTNSMTEWSGQRKSRETLEHSMIQAKQKVDYYRNNFPEIEFVSSALSPNGIPLMIVDHYLPLIESKAQAILRSISDGRMGLKLDIVDSGRKGVEIFSGTDQLRPIKSLSGGEQTRVSLSIRLALSQILFEMSNCHFDILFIDEPEYLDREGISQFIHSVNSLRSFYEQIFVISHLEEMKSAFPGIISVVKQDDVSSARIEG